MRVTGGTARGRRLKSPPAGVRPTSDLVRGAIFDALEAQGVELERVLDLYAGSGALGIEALSRGATWCDFVEREAKQAALVRENLELTGLAGRAKVYRFAVERAAERLEGSYSLILADPPYDDETAAAALDGVAGALAAPGATLVLEHSHRQEPPETLGPLRRQRRRRYGDTEVSFYQEEGAS